MKRIATRVTRGPGRAGGRRRGGAAAVEFALLLPVLVTTTFGSLDYGRAFMVMQELTNASRASARVGVVPGNGFAQIKAAASTALTAAGISGAPDPTVAVQASGSSTWVPATSTSDTVATANPGDAIKVTVNVPYQNVAWITGVFINGGTILTSTTVMGKE